MTDRTGSSMGEFCYRDLLKQYGAKHANYMDAHWNDLAAPGISRDVLQKRMVRRRDILLWEQFSRTHTEPDGAMGYQYTAEHRTGVRVGEDWLQIAAQTSQKPEIQALQVFTLYHSAMTDYGRKAA